MSYTEKQEHILTLRVSKETIARLRQAAREHHCSVSELARDILWSRTQEIIEGEQEHVFQNHYSWARAVKTRDEFRCSRCGNEDDLDVYLTSSLNQSHGGGEGEEKESQMLYTLSNGITLCFSCYQEHNPTECFAEDGRTIYDQLPQGWMRKYQQSKEKGRIFWELHLACFLTRRKRMLSPIVIWYAETFLRNVPEEVLIRTLVELCPSPEIIAQFPGRQYTSPNEQFTPPPLVWR